MTQSGIDRNMARYQYEATAPQQALANYMNMIGGNYGGTSTQTSPVDAMGTLGGLAQIATMFI